MDIPKNTLLCPTFTPMFLLETDYIWLNLMYAQLKYKCILYSVWCIFIVHSVFSVSSDKYFNILQNTRCSAVPVSIGNTINHSKGKSIYVLAGWFKIILKLFDANKTSMVNKVGAITCFLRMSIRFAATTMCIE